MSYCRWSTDSFRCDLYCYESDRGFETHVAGRRLVRTPDSPLDAPFSLLMTDLAAFTAQHKVFTAWMDIAEREPIGLPFDGETFNDPDLASFRERLVELRAAGYNFPDEVIEDVDAEIAASLADKPTGTEPSERSATP